MKLSIVTTLYKSEPYLDEFYQRITASALTITDNYELILVNDGSPDQVLQKALLLQEKDSNIIIIDLSRNFGHHEAGMVGLENSRGDYIFLIDSDLEEIPELLEQFWQTLISKETQADVMYGTQKIRKGRWLERWSGWLFYTLFNQLSDVVITHNLLTVRLMNRKFVDTIIKYQEKHLFVAGLMAHAGFTQLPIAVNKLSKKESSYTLGKQIKLFLTCITSFSSRPLEIMFFVGIIMLILSTLFGVILLFYVLFLSAQTISTGMVITFATIFVSAIILCSTGILGLYLGKIYDEVKQRPRAIIRTIFYGEKNRG